MKRIVFLFILCPLFANAQYEVMSVSGVEPNQTIVTRFDVGFITKNSGERLEGKIQLKVKKGDTLEVRFRGDNGKEVFKRNVIQSFGLLKTAGDYRVVKDETKNFHPGIIHLKNGNKLNGRIAVRAVSDAEEFGFHMGSVLFEKPDQYVSIIPAEQISTAKQTINGKVTTYENYKGGMLRHVVEGNLIVMRNPYPTTERSGLNNLVNQAADSAAKEMAERSLERNLGDAIAGDTDAQDQIEEDLDNAQELSNTNAQFMQNEYLVRSKDSGDLTIVKPDNFDQWAAGLKMKCAALNDRKDLMRYNKIYALARFYNSCH
ncbi:MAG: hypothetical protein RIF39_04030 [Cyclobacteriaceae bacterium]